MIIKKAQFVTSVADIKQTPESSLPIVAFVGRSNVGKSSLINAITNTKNLAKASSMPGRTRLVNYFLINDSIHFVDLPGYGYAQAGKEHKERWAKLLESYLRSNQNIKLILLLVDIRHTPTDQDKQMMRYLFHYNMPFKIVATKADKVPKSKMFEYVKQIANALSLGMADILPFSIETRKNKEELLALIERFVFQPSISMEDFEDESEETEGEEEGN